MYGTLENFLIKALLYMKVQFSKINQASGEVLEVVEINFSSKAADAVDNIEEWLQRHINYLNTHLVIFTQRDSGLEFDEIKNIDFKIMLAENRSGVEHFTIPPILKSKQAVVNVDTDKECFKYAIL